MSLPFRPADRLRNRNRSVWTIEDVARTEGPVLVDPVDEAPLRPSAGLTLGIAIGAAAWVALLTLW